MLDWKKCCGIMCDCVDNFVDDVCIYFGGFWLVCVVGGLLGIYLLVVMLVGWYWSQEFDLFFVQQDVQVVVECVGWQMVIGYIMVEIFKEVVDILLIKLGGYIFNDIFLLGIWMDNMFSWEYGVLVQVCDISWVLCKDFVCLQLQFIEDVDLVCVELCFNFDNKSWVLLVFELEYQEGIKLLDCYLVCLFDLNQFNVQFYVCVDNLNNWLGDVVICLGLLFQCLLVSVGWVKLNINIKNFEEVQLGEVFKVEEVVQEIFWLQIDNVFYEVWGQVWVLLYLLCVIEVDFVDVLVKKNVMVSVWQIICELEVVQELLWSLMVLNGSGYGILVNYLLVMVNYIFCVNVVVIDLCQLFFQG